MSDGSVVLAVLRLLVSLGAVLTLLVVLARYAAKRGLGGARTGRGTVTVDVLSRRSLGKSSSVQVVQVGSRVMVLGVTDRAVSVLTELGEADLAVTELPEGDSKVVRPVPGTAAADLVLAGSTGRPGEVPSRASRRVAAASSRPAQPLGWPWSAAALVLGQGRSRRG